MIDNLVEDLENISYPFARKETLKDWEKLKVYFYDFLTCFFQPQFNKKIQYKNQLLIETIKHVILCTQVISILWYPSMKIKGWSSCSIIWKFIWFVNYDSLLTHLRIYRLGFIIQVSIMGYLFIIWLLFFILNFFNRRISQGFIYVSQIITSFLATISFIPSLTILLVTFKYSTFDFSEVQEYYENDKSSFDCSIYGAILSPIFLVFLILVAFLNEFFTADLKHSNSTKNIRARSHSTLDLIWLAFCIIQVNIFIFVDQKLMAWYWTALLIMSIYLLIQFWIDLPYYSSMLNSIHTSKFGIISVCSIAFLCGYWNDDARTLTVLCIFFPPLVIFLSFALTFKRYSRLKTHTNSPRHQFHFERCLRHSLVDQYCDNIEEIIKIFSECFNKKKIDMDGLFVIWEANFCISIAKNERLGRLKLTKMSQIRENIEANYQKFRIINKLGKKSLSNLSEIKYMEYLTKLDEVKKYDKKICYELFKFWTEISSRKPKFTKLKPMMEKISNHSIKIKTLYKSILTNNNYSEAWELYGTFLKNILGEHEKGNLVLKKRNENKEMNSTRVSNSKIEYNENLCVILISLDADSFGTISYINKKASQVLKVSLDEAIGRDINDFIPKPYSLFHSEKMKQFYVNGIKTRLERLNFLVLQDGYGHIFECNLVIELTAFNNKAYFMVRFIEILCNRQVILLSKEGEIYNHSENLGPIIGYQQKDFSHLNISDVFPGVKLNKLYLFLPKIIMSNETKLALVHVQIAINLYTIHLIFVISDSLDIEKWQNEEAPEQIEFFGQSECQLNENYEEIRHKNPKNTLISINSADQISKAFLYEENLWEKAADYRVDQNQEKNILADQLSARYIRRTEYSIRKFWWILLYAILAMIGTNTGILIYIINNVNHTTSMEVFSNLGSIIFYIGTTPIWIRVAESEKMQGEFNSTEAMINLKYIRTSLIQLQNSLKSDYSEWSYCPSSEIIVRNIVPVWEFGQEPKIKHYNFYDFVSLFIEYIGKTIEDFSTKISYKDDIKWLEANSLSYPFQYSNAALEDLVECEKNRIYDKSQVVIILIIVGTLICGACLALLMYFSFILKFIYDKAWTYLRKSAIFNHILLKQACLDRLISVHGVEMTNEHILYEIIPKNMNFNIKTTLTKNFFIRLCIFVIISLCFYLFTVFYSYDICENYMINRPKLLQLFNKQRIVLGKILYYTKEISESCLDDYPNSCAFQDPRTEFDKLIEEYQNLDSNKLLSNGMIEFQSDDMKRDLYEKTDYSGDYLKYGLIPAAHSLIFDSIYMRGSYNESEFLNLFSESTFLQLAMSEFLPLSEKRTKHAIFFQLNIIVYTTVIFSIALGALYLCYYLPYLKREISFLKKSRILPKIISNLTSHKSEVEYKQA
ncbi:unnamed protein product [Blepharisma stoltei]|uniref:PAS domain-containing protein n=1 Tax=Blepharisma stoltei TaxID=1481888 RepID=A0AAU9JSY1_9CILI|nr:unnamed protein product [Blepharisma stoltei]